MLGYFNTPVFASHHIPVGCGHTLYVEEAGNPQGCPVVFLHGGPGGQVGESSRRFFDPEFYRIVLVDQRGCGKSQPFLSLEANKSWIVWLTWRLFDRHSTLRTGMYLEVAMARPWL